VAIGGSTTLHIAAVPHIGIVRPQTGLEAQPAEIPWLTVRPEPANRSVDRVAIWPATGLAEVASATEPAEQRVSAIAGVAESAPGIGLLPEEERTE